MTDKPLIEDVIEVLDKAIRACDWHAEFEIKDQLIRTRTRIENERPDMEGLQYALMFPCSVEYQGEQDETVCLDETVDKAARSTLNIWG